jgi:hypothetical protein
MDVFGDEFEDKITIAMCGTKCKHSWDGPTRDIIEDGRVIGGEATCTKCGAGALEVALMEDDDEPRRKRASLAAVIPQM